MTETIWKSIFKHFLFSVMQFENHSLETVTVIDFFFVASKGRQN